MCAAAAIHARPPSPTQRARLASCRHVVPLPFLAPPAHPTPVLAIYPLRLQMHLNGLEDSEKDGFLKKFFGVVCPVAATLQTKGRRLAVHWADSGEIRRETPKDQKRMAMPADACKDAANIDYWVGGRDGGRTKGALPCMHIGPVSCWPPAVRVAVAWLWSHAAGAAWSTVENPHFTPSRC